MSTPTLTITTELLREWQACKGGYSWFVAKFPQGGTYGDVQAALRAEKLGDYSHWLADKMFSSLLETPSMTPALVEEIKAGADVAHVDEDSARIGSSGESARIGSSGHSARIGSSGSYARIGSSGDSARIGSSGESAQINAEGSKAVIACAGLNTRVRSGEEGAVAAAYSDGKRIRFAVGYVGENLNALTWYSVNAAGEFVEVSE